MGSGRGRRGEWTALIVERKRETPGESLTRSEQLHRVALARQTFPAALQIGAGGNFLTMRKVGELLALRANLRLR